MEWIVQFSSHVDAISLFRWLSSKLLEADVEMVATISLELWNRTIGNISNFLHDAIELIALIFRTLNGKLYLLL